MTRPLAREVLAWANCQLSPTPALGPHRVVLHRTGFWPLMEPRPKLSSKG